MIAPANLKIQILLYERSPAEPFEADLRAGLLAGLLEGGFPVQVLRGEPSTSEEKRGDGENRILLGCFGGQSPVKDGEHGFERVHDVSGLGRDEILSLVDDAAGEVQEAPIGRRWKPWFPVIDFDRCTHCMQCLSFCLFDVYGATSDGKIQVQNESNCKTDCPACSRVCPEVAIMFPKYKAGPINGDVVSDDDVRREAMKVDISALLGGDIYALLRDRSEKAKSRFSKERDDDRALRERERCLNKLKAAAGGLDIPGEVLASLPSAGEIQEKAEEARRKAQQALALGATQQQSTPTQQ